MHTYLKEAMATSASKSLCLCAAFGVTGGLDYRDEQVEFVISLLNDTRNFFLDLRQCALPFNMSMILKICFPKHNSSLQKGGVMNPGVDSAGSSRNVLGMDVITPETLPQRIFSVLLWTISP